MAGLALIGVAGTSFANPTGGNVTAGSATINQPSSSVTEIQQQSDRAIIDWKSYSIGAGERTQYYQPSSSAFTLNRVTGGDPSVIAGQLFANGNIAIVNGSGIVFSKGAQVDVNGLIATTSDIHNMDFMAGRFNFNIPSANPNATVTNEGQITIGDHGLAALVAPGVSNSGIIKAKLGKVILGGAETFAVDFYGDGLISFDVGSKVAQAPVGPDGKPLALVSNTGQIYADGGTILLTADAADNILTDLVQAGGTLRAQTVGAKTGNVTVDGGGAMGGVVYLTGSIDTTGLDAGQTGGTATVLGDRVNVGAGATINASGDAGGGTVLVGGNFHGAGPQHNASAVLVQKGAAIKADAITNGDGGKIAVWSNNATGVYGYLSARGGAAGGNGGFIETSSMGFFSVAGVTVDASAARGSAGIWLLDPQNVIIATGGAAAVTDINAFATNAGTDQTVDPATIIAGLHGGTTVRIQAGNDITVQNQVDATGDAAATGNLALQAGRTIAVNADIKLNGGSFSATANDSVGANGAGGDADRVDAGAGNFAMTAGTSIDVSKGAASTITINVGASATNNDASGHDFTAGSVTLANLTTGTSGNLQVSGNATTIGQTGGTDALAIGGASSFASLTSGAGITLTDTNNAMKGAVSFNTAGSGGDVTLINSLATILGTSNVSGTLGVQALAGNLSQSGALTVLGTGSSFTTAAAGATLTLSNAANALNGVVSLHTNGSGGNATLTNNVATTLNASAIGGNLLVTDTTGNLGQSGTLTVHGTSSFTTSALGATITLGDANNALTGTVSLHTTGAGANAALVNNAATTLGASKIGGSLAVKSGVGNLDQSGALTVQGTSSFTTAQSGATITLSNAGNAMSGAVSLNTTGAGANAILVNAVATTLANSSVGGNLVATTTGLGSNLAVSGLAAGDDSALISSGALTFAGTVDVGAHNLFLSWNGLLTAPAASITAGGLAVNATGDVALTGAVSTTGGFARIGADITGGGLSYQQAGSFTVGVDVNAPGHNNSFGITAANTSTVGLVSTAGDLTLAQNVTAGNVLLSAQAGAVSETTGGVIANAGGAGQGSLIVLAANNSTLNNAANSVGVLAANVSNGGFSYTNAGVLTIGTAIVTPPGSIFPTIQSGVAATADIGVQNSVGNLTVASNVTSTGGDSALVAANALTLNGTVDVGAHNLLLGSSGSAYTNNGTITAGGLVVQVKNAIGDLSIAGNFARIGAVITGATNNSFSYIATGFGALTAGVDMNLPNSPAFTGSYGISAPGNVGVSNVFGDINIAQAVSGANVLLSTFFGAVTESGAGAVTASAGAGNLIVRALGAIDMQGANDVGTLAASSGAGIAFNDATSLTVGTNVAVNAPGLSDSLSNVSGGGDIGLKAGGNIALAGNVTGVNVGLSATGAVSENASAGVAANSGVGNLVVRAGTTINMPGLNQVGTFAALAGGGIAFNDALAALVVGTNVAVNPPSLGDTLSDVTAGGDVALRSASNITLAGNVAGTNVGLNAAGAISEPGTGGVLAGGGNLVLRAGGAINMASASNNVGTLAALAGGNIAFNDSTSLTVGTNVGVNPPSLADNLSNVTAAGDSALVSGGDLRLAGNVNVGGAGLRLNASGGALSETAGTVTASRLIALAQTDIDMAAANNAVLFAAAAGQGIAFNNVGALNVASVTVNPPSLGGTTTGITAGADSAVVASGGLSLFSNVNVAGNLRLRSTGGTVFEPVGSVTANGLLVQAQTKIDMETANNVQSFAAAAGQGISFTNTPALSIGTVTVNSPSLGATLSNVTAGGDSAFISGGTLTLNGPVNVGAHNLLLQSTGGSVLGSGAMTANALLARAAGDIHLDALQNQVSTFAVQGGGNVTFQDALPLTLGGVNVAPPTALFGTQLVSSLFQATAGGMLAVASFGPVTTNSGETLGAGSIIKVGGNSFTQNGVLTVTSGTPVFEIVNGTGLTPASLGCDACQTAPDVNLPPGPGPGPVSPGTSAAGLVTFANLQAPGTQVIVSSGGGAVTGFINVGGFGITGNGATADLFGTIGGVGGGEAANRGIRSPNPNNANRFNNCAIGSVNCIALPLVIPVIIQPINVLELLQARAPSDPLDIDRINTGNDDSL